MTAPSQPPSSPLRGHGQKLSRKQDAIIAALLSEPTYAKAAAKAGIAESTLNRWLAIPEFAEAFRQARERATENARDQLQLLNQAAVETLQRNLTCGKPAVEYLAAKAILELSQKFREDAELAEKLETLKAHLNATNIAINFEASSRGMHPALGVEDGTALANGESDPFVPGPDHDAGGPEAGSLAGTATERAAEELPPPLFPTVREKFGSSGLGVESGDR
jgi:hypothetical protein